MLRTLCILFLLCCIAAAVPAQQPPGFGGGPGHPPSDSGPGGRRGPPGGPRDLAEGKWWYNPRTVQRLGLSTDQQRKIEDIFQQNRLKLIDLTAALEREQAILDPLLSADRPQEARVLAQFDRVADARRDLEKANARMLWGFRTVLTADQWKDLQAQDGAPPPGLPRDRGPSR